MTDPLQHEFDELADALNDFVEAGHQGVESIFKRIVAVIEREPMRSLITSLTPPVSFPAWYATSLTTVGAMVGSGELEWPADRAERVSMTRELFRAIGRSELLLFEVAHTFTYGGGRYADSYQQFARVILTPFLRDLARLVNMRADPPVLSEALARPFPESGDAVLDELLAASRDSIRDVNPASRRAGLEKLWDAWERLKSLNDATDKKASVAALLDHAATEPAFRDVLEQDARALTAIGNGFHIRHFETSKTAIASPEHVDYLFHRLWALVWLALEAHVKRGAGARSTSS